MLYCFADTNIFLEYQTFDEVDWPELLEVSEVCLVVARRVIQEMDKLKNDPRSERRRKRSRMILNKIESYWAPQDALIRRGTYLRVLTDSPSSTQLQELSYDPEVPDDEIVGVLHLFVKENPEAEAVLLAADTGIRLKARASGLDTIAPPAEIRLPDEPDPLQKEINQLRAELARSKSRKADLSIGFRQRGSIERKAKFVVKFDEREMTPNEIDQAVEVKKAELEYQHPSTDPEPNPDLDHLTIGEIMERFDILPLRPPPEEEIENYQRQLEQFLKRYRKYLQELSTFRQHASRTRPVYLAVGNNGSVPADDIDVKLSFPDGLTLRSDPLRLPQSPTPPKKPEPRTIFEALASVSSNMAAMAVPPNPRFLPYWDWEHLPADLMASGPVIRKTNGYEVELSLDRLKQHRDWTWPPLYATFDKPERQPTGIEVGYEITAANIPELIEGTLVIRLE